MSATRVAIIDSGGANIASLQFALSRLGVYGTLTSEPDTIRESTHVILPGVGAAADAMQRLAKQNLRTLLGQLVQPVLGICLGMHLLAEYSEENDTECLGIVPGTAMRLPGDTRNPVPNMGWCRIEILEKHDLLRNIDSGSHFYFLHSYALPAMECALSLSTHTQPFTSILARRNFMGTQFHPERSAAPGAQLLRNFLDMRA